MDPDARLALYNSLKQVLEQHRPPFAVSEQPGKYSLSTARPVVIDGKNYDSMYFAGIRELKNIVGFYFMPVYTDPDLRESIPASLRKILKGHTCFNVKVLTPEMAEDLHTLLRIGIERYREKGWL